MKQTDQPLWNYVPLSEYAAPQATISRTIKGGIKEIWQRFKRQVPDSDHPPVPSLEYLSKTALEKVAPAPDWTDARTALWAAVEKKSGSASSCVLMVAGLPGSGNRQILTGLAQTLGWRLIQPPSPDQILSEDLTWLDQMVLPNTPWVLPELGELYLRHARGLTLMRQLLSLLNSKRLYRGIIGCDSWALAYLRQVLPNQFPDTLVAQAFDDESLARWFNGMAAAGCGGQIRFCQADNGELVLPVEPDPSLDNGHKDNSSGVKASAFMNQLAAYSFGIPGIAFDIWKKALKREPDQPMIESQIFDTHAQTMATIWVEPWEKLDSLMLPQDLGPESPLLMHTLLLHNGLSEDLLTELLPFSANSVSRTAMRLKDAGIVEDRRGVMAISSRGYPMVRRYLNGEGYLTDQF